MLTIEQFEIMNNAPLNATHFLSNIASGETNYAKKVDGEFVICNGSGWFLMHAWNVDECIEDLRKQRIEDLILVALVNSLRGDIERASTQHTKRIFNLCAKEMSEHAGSDAFIEYLKQLEQRDFTSKVKKEGRRMSIPTKRLLIVNAIIIAVTSFALYV